MARNERVQRLRAEAARLERNATRKISRLRHGKVPVELSGSEFDPRKGQGNISSMRSRDLQVHIRRLEKFNQRTTRFMPTAEGIAGPDVVNRLLRAQSKLNAKRERKRQRFGETVSHTGVETIAERFAMSEPAQRKMADPAIDNPFRKLKKEDIRYTTPEAIEKMAKKFEKQATAEYDREQRAKNRETLQKILDVVDEPALQVMVDQMTDAQFDLMWFDPDFMNGQGFIYAMAMGKTKGDSKMSRAQTGAFEDSVATEKEQALGIAGWALLVGSRS